MGLSQIELLDKRMFDVIAPLFVGTERRGDVTLEEIIETINKSKATVNRIGASVKKARKQSEDESSERKQVVDVLSESLSVADYKNLIDMLEKKGIRDAPEPAKQTRKRLTDEEKAERASAREQARINAKKEEQKRLEENNIKAGDNTSVNVPVPTDDEVSAQRADKLSGDKQKAREQQDNIQRRNEALEANRMSDTKPKSVSDSTKRPKNSISPNMLKNLRGISLTNNYKKEK